MGCGGHGDRRAGGVEPQITAAPQDGGKLSLQAVATRGSFGRAAAERTAELVSGDYRFVEVKAGHWLPEANADLVAEEITRRVRSAP